MQKETYLQAMDVDVWRLRENAADVAEAPISISTNEPWEQLSEQANTCTACALHKTRTHVVFGVGNKNADLLIIGEAPGAQEDKQGEPFVGRAGQLLNNMLKAIGLSREQIYIANILKCRPPNNRDPNPEEVDLCTPFLTKQIEMLQPKVIMTVGRIAAHFLLDSNLAMARLRGKPLHYGEKQIPLIVTYHPAYLLRSPKEKRKAWDDLLLLKTFL